MAFKRGVAYFRRLTITSVYPASFESGGFRHSFCPRFSGSSGSSGFGRGSYGGIGIDLTKSAGSAQTDLTFRRRGLLRQMTGRIFQTHFSVPV